MNLSEVQKQNILIEYQRLVDKMLDLERRRDEVEDEEEKRILTNILEKHYQKVYTVKANYDIQP
jgi:HSP20 family molecular chaperone IbpA